MTEKTETCNAAANLKGEHIWCDEPAGHTGWAHGNAEHGLIWDGPNQRLTKATACTCPASSMFGQPSASCPIHGTR